VAIEEVRIPDIGDAEDVEVIELCVESGSHVEVNDSLLVLESDKASMEVPAPHTGIVREIKVTLGDKVVEGQVVATLEAVADAAVAVVEKEDTAEPEASRAESLRTVTEMIRVPDVGDAQDITIIEIAVKAGDNVAAGDLLVVVESDKASMEIPSPRAGTVREVLVSEGSEVQQDSPLVSLETAAQGLAEEALVVPPKAVQDRAIEDKREQSPLKSADTPRVYAGPAVRRLARELGVPLSDVRGTGNHGRVTKDDLQNYIKSALTDESRPPPSGSAIPAIAAVDFSKFGAVEKVALSRIRQRGASNLHRSWLNVPHVTQHDDADITDLEVFRKQMKGEAERRGLKLTPLAFIMKACAFALRQFPVVNSSLDADARYYIIKHYCHIGFAVDTPEGLLVPVVRDVDAKGVWQLTEEIAGLSEKARNNQLSAEEMQGGSFTISSLGAIGGTAFTPIVNAPQVAILGVSRLQTRPLWNGSSFEPRKILPVSLSYDHRAINGAEAGRFVTFLSTVLADFRHALM